MKALVFVFAVMALLAVTGCNPEQHNPNAAEPTTPSTTAVTPAPGGSGGDVQIHSMGAGAVTPVTGGDNLMGSGGGGVESAAKAKAKSTAAGAGASSSLSQMPTDDAPSTVVGGN